MPLKSQLKQLKLKKAEVSSQFKQVQKNSHAHSVLLQDMQAVCEQIKQVESALKIQNNCNALPIVSEAHAPPMLGAHFNVKPLVDNWQQPFEVRELLPQEYRLWWDFLAAQTAVSGCFQPAWLQAIEAAFGHKTLILAAVSSDGHLLGGVPLVLLQSLMFGRFAVSLPFVNYGGVVTHWKNIAEALIAGAAGLCVKYQLKHVEIRTLIPDLTGVSSSKKVSMVLPLPDSIEALDTRLGAKLRAQCKKAQQYTPSFKVGGVELLNDFYSVFARNMRDLGTPVYHKKWFNQLFQQPGITAAIAVVYMAGKPVSAGFLVGHNGVLEIPWASTLKQANLKNANMWLYKNVLDYAIKQGYSLFDFGRSTKDSGTYQFKKQWGAMPVPHYWYYATTGGKHGGNLNPDNPKFKLAIRLWRCLPVWLTKLIGPPIVKYLP